MLQHGRSGLNILEHEYLVVVQHLRGVNVVVMHGIKGYQVLGLDFETVIIRYRDVGRRFKLRPGTTGESRQKD